MLRAARVGGRRRRALLLLALCVSLVGVSGWFFFRSVLTPDTGLIRYDPEVAAENGDVRFVPSSPFTAPLSAGVEPRQDRILALDSHPIAGTRDLVRAALGVRDFGPYSLEVQRDGGLARSVAVTPDFRPARLDWIFELVFCVTLSIAAFVLCRRFPDAVSTFPLALSILLSLLFTCIMPFSFESLAANLIANAGNISSWLLVIFAMYFPWLRGSRALRGIVVGGVVFLYAAFCILRAALYAQWMDTGLESLFSAYRQIGRLVIFSDGAAYAVLAALLGSAYAQSRLPRDRRMLQWMLAGVLIAFPPYFLLDQLPVVMGGPLHQVGLGSVAQLFLSVLPIFLLLALTGRRPLNLRSFLARYGTWGTLLVMTVVVFGGCYLPLVRFLTSAYRVASPLPEVLAAAVLMTGIGILRYPVERLFYPARAQKLEGLEGIISLADAGAASTRRLAEVRAVVHGIVRTLQQPVKLLAESAAHAGTDRQKEAGAEAEFFLGMLGSLCGSASSRSGPAMAEELAGAAVAAARQRFPAIVFKVRGESRQSILCYADEVTQALGLLLDNAAEANPAPGAVVAVRCSSDQGRAVIEISDSGPGLEGEARRKLFKPFWTSKPGHRGLGLYFARIALERNEGGVVLAASSSGGALARVSFPLDAAEAT
jgi:signal transduction histidine kinase